MAPFDRLLQRINAVGCAGFVIVVLIHVLGWVSGSRGGDREPFALANVLGSVPSLTVRAASRNGGDALSMDDGNVGLVATEWTERTPVNRLTLDPAPPVWPSEEDARLAAAHARYMAWFREYQRHISPTSIEPGEVSSKSGITAFNPATQYAYASNCSAQMSEVAELTQHR